jgi:hypothetical protein
VSSALVFCKGTNSKARGNMQPTETIYSLAPKLKRYTELGKGALGTALHAAHYLQTQPQHVPALDAHLTAKSLALHLSVQEVFGVFCALWAPLILVPARGCLGLQAGDGATKLALHSNKIC